MAKRSNGMFYAKKAEKEGGCRIEYGKGDHIKIYPPDGGRPMICPRNLKGNGTEHSIVKWLKALGVIISLAALISFIF